LEQLNVVSIDQININDSTGVLVVNFTPTITGCSMATLIGLCITVKLIRYLPKRYKIQVYLKPGSHSTEEQVNKQLNDKERVAAALENPKLFAVVQDCLAGLKE
jgi:metal-sulfur cluster biosynthetic enzyme